MKKHYALIDTNGNINDTLEINEGEIMTPPDIGFQWVEIKNIDKDFHKDPEKFKIDKNKHERKEQIILTASTTKAFVGDTITITVDIPGKNKSCNLVINNQTMLVNDEDIISVNLVDEGVYKIFCDNTKFYCPVLYIDVLERL